MTQAITYSAMRRAPSTSSTLCPCAGSSWYVAPYRAASAAPVSGGVKMSSAPDTNKDRRGEFRGVDGKRPARRLVDPQGRFWDEERVEMRGLHVVQALKKHLPSEVGWRRPPWRVHIADGKFMRCCADVRRHDRRQQNKAADLVRRRE